MPPDSRFVRGLILKVLYAEHPAWVNDGLLRRALDDLGCSLTQERLASELIYLRDWPADNAGYVELQGRHVPRTGEAVKESRVTPRGVNLVERLVPSDPMVVIE